MGDLENRKIFRIFLDNQESYAYILIGRKRYKINRELKTKISTVENKESNIWGLLQTYGIMFRDIDRCLDELAKRIASDEFNLKGLKKNQYIGYRYEEPYDKIEKEYLFNIRIELKKIEVKEVTD